MGLGYMIVVKGLFERNKAHLKANVATTSSSTPTSIPTGLLL